MANNGNRVFDVYTQSGDCVGYNGWWDKKFKRILECASKDYSAVISRKTLELAKDIDKA